MTEQDKNRFDSETSFKTEHRLSSLEKDAEEDRAASKANFKHLYDCLTEALETLAKYEEKLENLWQWKLYQNGILSDIRNDQKEIPTMLNTLWIKIMAGIIVAIIVSCFVIT